MVGYKIYQDRTDLIIEFDEPLCENPDEVNRLILCNFEYPVSAIIPENEEETVTAYKILGYPSAVAYEEANNGE